MGLHYMTLNYFKNGDKWHEIAPGQDDFMDYHHVVKLVDETNDEKHGDTIIGIFDETVRGRVSREQESVSMLVTYFREVLCGEDDIVPRNDDFTEFAIVDTTDELFSHDTMALYKAAGVESPHGYLKEED